MDKNEHLQAAIDMSVSTLGQSLMQLVLQELKAQYDVWQKLPEYKQAEVIERVKANIEQAVSRTVTLIASQGCQRVVGVLEKVNIGKEKSQVTINLYHNNDIEAVHELYNSINDTLMIVLASPDQFTGGMDQVQPDPDQNEMDLEHPDPEHALEN